MRQERVIVVVVSVVMEVESEPGGEWGLDRFFLRRDGTDGVYTSHFVSGGRCV